MARHIAGDCAVCEPAVQRFGTAQGLSHNAVVAMAQDSDGFVWLATRDGLDRLDGGNVENFGQLGAQSLRAERISALAADPGGGLWIGVRDGVLHRERDGAVQFYRGPTGVGDTDASVTSLLAVDAAGVWVGHLDGLMYQPRAHDASSRAVPQLRGESVRGMRMVHGELRVLSSAEGCRLHRVDPRRVEATRVDPAPCLHALAVEGDGLWRDATMRWSPGEPMPAPLDGDSARAILAWRGGLVFAGLRGAVWRSPTGELVSLWQGRRAWHPRSIDSEVLDAMIDTEDVLWLATYDGAYRLDPDAPTLLPLGEGGALADALRERPVSDLLWARKRWWIGSFGHGLLAWDPRSDDVSQWSSTADDAYASWCDDFIWDLLPLDERVVVNARCGVDAKREVVALPWMPPAPIRDSLVDARGEVWMATLDGLYQWVEGRAVQRLPGDYETLTEGAPGLLWLVPALDAVHAPPAVLTGFSVGDGARRHLALPTGSRVYDMHYALDRVWLATGLGLLEIDPVQGHVTRHVPQQPNAGRVMFSVQPDVDGHLWLGSNRGLLRFDPAAVQARRFRLYDQRDGLGFSEFNRRSRAVDDQGRLLFGGIGGVVRFDPRRAGIAAPAPVPRVTRAHIWSRAGERVLELPAQPIGLAPTDLAITFEFGAPGFRRAGHIGYRYRLHGVDPDWVKADGARSARYPRLLPGSYRLQLEAGSDEAGWRASATPLDLHSAPAWYESLWFRLTAVLMLALASWALYRWRVGQLLQLERLRTRIAADLHDELGSELAAIGMSAAMLGTRDELAAVQRGRLLDISDSTERVAAAMRDIVWYVNPDKDTFEALGERLLALARRMFEGVNLEFENGWRGRERALPMAMRREVHLICKEAFTNIVRHAQADKVRVQLQHGAQGFGIQIDDNGRGFAPGSVTGGHGLSSLRRRADAIGARLRIDSAPGQGTQLELVLTHLRRGSRRTAAIP